MSCAAPAKTPRDLGPYSDRGKTVLSIWHKALPHDGGDGLDMLSISTALFDVSKLAMPDKVGRLAVTFNPHQFAEVFSGTNRIAHLSNDADGPELNAHYVTDQVSNFEYLMDRVGGLCYRIWLELPEWERDDVAGGWRAKIGGETVAGFWPAVQA